MTTVPTSLERPLEVQIGGHGSVARASAGLLAAVAIGAGAVGLLHDGVVAGTWVRSGLVTAWALAALVLTRRGDPAPAFVTATAAAVGGVCAATAGVDGVEGVHMVAALLVPALALHVELVIPEGRLGTGGRRTLVVAAYSVAAVVGIGLALDGRQPTAGAVAAAVVVALLLGVPAAHQIYLRSAGRARERLQLVGCAVAVLLEVALVAAGLHLLVDWPSHWAEPAAAAGALVPLAVAAGTFSGVARWADRVLVHTVSATGLTAVVVAVYLVVVIGLGRAPERSERTLLVLSMLAAAVAALAYVPARERLEETANRLVYGERHPPDEVLRTWGSRLTRAIPMDELLLQLAESLRKVLALERAEIWTGSPDRLELAVSVPDRAAPPLRLSADEQPIVARAGVTGTAWLEVWLPDLLEGRTTSQLRVAPAAHSGELLGLLVIERAHDGDAFTEEDDRMLTELARQVGLALHNVRLDSALQESLEHLEQANEDLQASRARIVATGDAERRKIERNLHDGAQQHLVALAVNLRLAKDILAEDPDGAVEMLDALAEAVKETIQELRDLAHGIYPPLLMDSGLPEALRAAANRSPLAVSVETDGLGRYPTELEAAVYFCCMEAIQNAAKHAPGAEVVVSVTEDEGVVHFSVIDDGPGFDVAAATAGHGYVNMSDRVGAIGGTVEWTSAPGRGARIVGTIPVA